MTQHPRPTSPQASQEEGEIGLGQLAAALATPVADLYRARELGLLPDPAPAGRWPQATAAEIMRCWPQTAAAVAAARELGTTRSAELLGRLTGLPVAEGHITDLAARGLLTSSRSYKNRPLYRVTDLHTLATDPDALTLLTQLTAPFAVRPDPAGGTRR